MYHFMFEVEKPCECDNMVFGAVYVAGLASGFWRSQEEIKSFWKLDSVFEPKDNSQYESLYTTWQDALHRSFKWYKHKI